MSDFIYLFLAYFIIVTVILLYLVRNFSILTRIERILEQEDSKQ